MIYYGGNDYRDYIAHYGVVGMHWGIRRYQPYSYTEGRDGVRQGKEMGVARKLGDTVKRAGSSLKRTALDVGRGIKTHAAEQKVKRAEKRVIRQRQKEEKRIEKERARKESIINSGDIEKVMKNKSSLTTDEIKRAVDRIRTETTLRELESEEAMKSIERGKKMIATVADITRNVGSIYDTVSGIRDKMDKANRDKEERAKAEENKAASKKMDEIIKTGDHEKIMKAVRNGELDAEHIKTASEIMRNLTAIDTRAERIETKAKERQQATEAEARKQEQALASAKAALSDAHKAITEEYQTKAKEEYEQNIAKLQGKDTEAKAREAVKQVFKDLGYSDRPEYSFDISKGNKGKQKSKNGTLTLVPGKTVKSDVELTLDPFGQEKKNQRDKWNYEASEARREADEREADSIGKALKAQADHTFRSEAAKKGVATKRQRTAGHLQYEREADLNRLINSYKNTSVDEAINSINERRIDKHGTKEEKVNQAVLHFKAEREKKDANAPKSGYEYFKDEREEKDAKATQEALEKLKKRGFTP